MSLTQLINLIKKYGPFILLGIIGLFIIFYSVRVVLLLSSNQRSENILIDPKFGPISRPQIINTTNTKGHKFVIDTVEGQPVTATKSAYVYFLTPPSTKFGYRDRITSMAKQLGFSNINDYLLNGNTASFKNEEMSLDINISNFNFIFKSNYQNNPDLFIRSIIPTATDAEDAAKEFLKNIGRSPLELDNDLMTVNYYYFNTEKKQTVPVARNIDANIAEVNFNRGNLENIPTVSKRFPNSVNFIRLASTDRDFIPIEAQINFFERSLTQIGSYSLITGDQAYEKLKKGEGIVLFNKNPEKKDIIIKKMYIAYYEPEVYFEYLEPVYIFEGDGFAALIWAITEDFLKN